MPTTHRVLFVVGARPNFMKIAPILREMDVRAATENVLLHTGQHYDADMSDTFFHDLGIRAPDVNLGVGSGSHGAQTSAVLARTEEILLASPWDLVIVVGDVNSTLAAALAASKLGIAVAHVEAGLRSGDRSMPEEINRILTDQLSDLCLTPSRDAADNLRFEGIGDDRIVFVGNVMIDSLLFALDSAREGGLPVSGLVPGEYGVVTLHRPSNVDDPGQLGEIVRALERIAADLPLIFPVHPRTANALKRSDIRLDAVRTVPPLGYKAMLALQADARVVLTDSGGIQEETTVLGVPCITLRSTTERPITIEEGTNRLVPVRSYQKILEALSEALDSPRKGRRPDGWDGQAASRIADAVIAEVQR